MNKQNTLGHNRKNVLSAVNLLCLSGLLNSPANTRIAKSVQKEKKISGVMTATHSGGQLHDSRKTRRWLDGREVMNPTKQTILHDPANGLHGNCLSAVLASLLHLPIDDVPLFITPDTWVKDLNEWLRQFGLAYCMVEDFECHIDAYGIKGLWHEVSGNTSRSKDVTHACVAKDGEFVFDPHPDDTGLIKITCHGFFIALEPWQSVTRPSKVGADKMGEGS